MDTKTLMDEAINQIGTELLENQEPLTESDRLWNCSCGKELVPKEIYHRTEEKRIILSEGSFFLFGRHGEKRFKGNLITDLECGLIKRNYPNLKTEPRTVNRFIYDYPQQVKCEECALLEYLSDKDYSSEKLLDVFKHIGIPYKFCVENFDVSESLNRFVPMTKRGRGLFLHGTTGTGKTTALISIFKHWLKTHFGWGTSRSPSFSDWKFINFPMWIIELQSAYRRDVSPSELIKELCEKPFLIIDDIGAEKMTDFVRQTTYALINEREMEMRPTFITSNFALQRLNEHIDERVASRIAGMCEVIELKGKDRRITKPLAVLK